MTKNQHFIPQVLLRNFSCDKKRRMINIYLLKFNEIKYAVGLTDQASKRYLYGADQKLEKVFCHFETLFGHVLKKLLNEDINLNDNEEAVLRLFMILQLNRTPIAEKNYHHQINMLFKNTLSHYPKYKKIIDDFSIELTHPYYDLLNLSLRVSFLISDLKVGLIKCCQDSQFIIGEQPIVLLNPYLFEKKWPGAKQGIGQKGTIIVMPISQNYSVILYDSIRYGLSNFKKIIQVNNEDEDILNYCQFLQTSNCIFFKEKTINMNTFQKMNRDSESFRIKNKHELQIFKSQLKEDKYSELLLLHPVDFPIKQNFKFVAIKADAYQDHITTFADIGREYVNEFEAYRKIQERLNSE